MTKKSKALFEYDEAGNVTAKTCSKCGTMTPLTEFAKDKRRTGGVESSCKACKSIKDANYRARKYSQGRQAKNGLVAEEIYISGKRKFGAMLRNLFPNEIIITDLEIVGHTVDFYLSFAHIVVNCDPVSGDDKRMVEVRAEIMRRVVVGEEIYEGEDEEEFGVCENPGLEGKDITSLIEVTPGREMDAIRRIIIAIAEVRGSEPSTFMRNQIIDYQRIDHRGVVFFVPAS